ncbi:Sec-independent protein translocase protein TatB [Novosphingobium sp. Fuku2-ISO-50]|uniref:Sec-independent protein translocase protein TatB n=1 Tax=Novosphingobium sp. Fuku2-ISO-50 TaxID=1739114 RepID=UPI00076DADFC|nr:Sec-independent protein translocase protein TatB [Novosphingobium sp. Fuku2-ISO-50]KUR81181.1 preprotein translocase subunit TatB [Novosphingobium sp. Fuku2-ISO-50]
MFDIAPSEFLLIAIVAVVVIGPKDLPMALRTAGRWIARVRRVSNHFKAGVETMIREAEMEEMERKWREQNAAIMAATPVVDPAALPMVEHGPLEHPPVEHPPIDPLVAAHAPTEPMHELPAPSAPEAPAATHPDHTA